MKKYTVILEETWHRVVNVEADTEENAIEAAKNKIQGGTLADSESFGFVEIADSFVRPREN